MMTEELYRIEENELITREVFTCPTQSGVLLHQLRKEFVTDTERHGELEYDYKKLVSESQRRGNQISSLILLEYWSSPCKPVRNKTS